MIFLKFILLIRTNIFTLYFIIICMCVSLYVIVCGGGAGGAAGGKQPRAQGWIPLGYCSPSSGEAA